MKLIRLTRITALLSCLLILPAHAEGPVWKISKGGHQLYLGGTIHLLTEADYPLPQAFEQAYQQSKQLVLETDIQKLKTPGFEQALMREVMYTDGRNLATALKPETYKALEAYLSSRGIPIANMMQFKPGMVAMTMTVIELQRLGFVQAGVDEFFSKKAMKDGKQRGQLETLEAQLAFIANMGIGQEDEMITYTLRDIQQLSEMMQSMKSAWREGNIRKLEEIGIKPFKKDFPGIYSELLVKRNNAWMPQIEGMLKTQDVELVLVGALHLAGKEGLLAQLSTRGYQVQRMP